MDLNKKTVTGPEERLQTVIEELDITIDDLLDKASFTIMQFQKLAEEQRISITDKAVELAYKQSHMEMLSRISLDYVGQAQSALTSLILRERREGRQVNG